MTRQYRLRTPTLPLPTRQRWPLGGWLSMLPVLLLMLGTGCGAEELLTESTPVPGAAATAARAAATPIPTPSRKATLGAEPSPAPARVAVSPVAKPESREQAERQMQAVVAEIRQALASQNLAHLEPLMLERVAVTTRSSGGETMSRERVRAWLDERIGPGIKVAEWRNAESYGLLEVVTEAWPQRGSLESGKVTFNLHRFNDDGQQDDLRGQWKVDVIIAE